MIKDSCENNCKRYDHSAGRCNTYGPMILCPYYFRITTDDMVRNESVIVCSNSKVAAFLYYLLKDKVPAGEVESVMREVEKNDSFKFTNGWLAQYAIYLDNRLHGKGKINEKDKV